MESSNPRPRNPRHGCGLQARTHGSPRPTQGQSTFALFVNGVQEDRGRNFGTLTKGGLDKRNPRFRPVCKQFVFSSKTRRGFPPGDQFEGSKRIPSVQPLQDGGNPSSARLNAPQRLVGQNRSQGCVFRGPHLGKSQEISPISLAPRVFTKIMKPVVALLRRTGIRLIIYLDDLLFMNSSKVGLQQDMTTAQYLLENLGFVINLEKSCFQPTQQLEFLGFVVNTLDMTLLLPDCKVEAIKSHCSKMLLHHEVSVRELSQLIGKLTASIQAIFPAPLHYRHLQDLKHKALARFGHFDATTALSTEAKDELQWWLAHLNAWNGRALVRPSPDVIIETDASRTGWGAVCQGETTGGLWSQMEKKLHINCLELLAGSFAVKSFTKDRLCVHVRLRMDNIYIYNSLFEM